MNPTEKQIYNYLQSLMPKFSEENLELFTAKHISDYLHISRNSASQYLNRFFQSGITVKINSRPVYFLDKSYLEKSYGVRLSDTEFLSFGEFILNLKESGQGAETFENAIGSRSYLGHVIRQIKAALNYPERGLPILVYGETGTGKSYLLWLAYKYALDQGLISAMGKNIVFHCAEYAGNKERAALALFDGGDSSYLAMASEGVLVFDDIDRLDTEVVDRLLPFMDMGKYQSADGKWHESNVRLLFITKQDPSACVMKSLIRRIPVVVSMPRLCERTIAEKEQFIICFLKNEIKRNRRPIFISSKAFDALLNYTYPENLNGMSKQIQLACASAAASANKGEPCIIYLYHLPDAIIGSVQVNKQYEDNESVLIDVLNYKNKDDSHKILDYYNAVTDLYEDCSNGKIDLNNFWMKAAEEAKRYCEYLISERTYENKTIKGIETIVNQIIEQFREEYAIYIPANIERMLSREVYVRSVLGQAVIAWDERHGCQVQQILDSVLEEYERQKKISIVISQRINQELEIEIGKISILFLLLQISSFNKKVTDKQMRGIIICHGYATAKSIADTENRTLGRTVFMAFDMPFDTSVNELSLRLENYMKQLIDCEHLVILVDCGSVEEIDSLMKFDKMDIGILDNVSTKLAMEVGRRILDGQDIETIAKESCDRIHSEYRLILKENRREAIAFFSENGINVSKRFSKLFANSLEKKIEIELIPLDCEYADDKILKEQLIKNNEVLMCIGTMNPEIPDVPFLAMQDIISFKHIQKVHTILNPYLTAEELELFDKKLLQNFSLQNVISNLTILNPERVINIVGEGLENLQANLGVKFKAKTIIGLNIHLCCLLERLVLNQPIENYRGIDVFEKEEKEFIHYVQKSFISVKEYFRVEIPIAEIAYIHDFYINDKNM